MVKIVNIILLVIFVLAGCTEYEEAVKSTNIPTETIILPALHIQPTVYQLGDIKEGEAAIATFLIRNNSNQDIELIDIQASCGCTAAEPDSYIIPAGSFTQLKVAVDTTAKQNDIKKVVHITDSLGNKATATLTFNVVNNPHFSMAEGAAKGIFDGQCASCHFAPLVGVSQPDKLYEVGCAMCHGVNAEGAYAPSLQGMTSLPALRHAIAHGMGNRQMPGFADINGGPLTFEQIESLARWLSQLDSNSELNKSLPSNR